jgi:hypothetical protein
MTGLYLKELLVRGDLKRCMIVSPGNLAEQWQEEFNRADQLNNERKNTVGFALTILQRQLASSPEAIYQSLKHRRERLENRLAEERIGKRAAEYTELSDWQD